MLKQVEKLLNFSPATLVFLHIEIYRHDIRSPSRFTKQCDQPEAMLLSKVLAAAGVPLIWAACATAWGQSDTQVHVAVQGLIWSHSPTAVRVCDVVCGLCYHQRACGRPWSGLPPETTWCPDLNYHSRPLLGLYSWCIWCLCWLSTVCVTSRRHVNEHGLHCHLKLCFCQGV